MSFLNCLNAYNLFSKLMTSDFLAVIIMEHANWIPFVPGLF